MGKAIGGILRPHAAGLLTACVAAGARAAPLDTTADAVLGQTALTTNVPGSGSGAVLSLSNTAHAAVGPDGQLWASDPENHRVLSWARAAAFNDGQAADFILGQPDAAGRLPNAGSATNDSGFFLPQGVDVDAQGNVWVTDAFNSRVLKFNDPHTDATPTAADLVIGQPDFSMNCENNDGMGRCGGGSGPDAAREFGLQFPGRVLVDASGDVWVADSGNSRVLHYPAPAANQPGPDQVLGQFGNFNKRAKNNDGQGNNGTTASAQNMLNPIGLALDADGRLYVADWGNHRVLRFDDPLNDDVADAVFGQPSFDSNDVDNGGPASGFRLPVSLTIDPIGNLYIADSGNNRVLVYVDPLSDPSTADMVLGQLGSFAGQAINHGLGVLETDADGLWGPSGVALDTDNNLYIVDTNNHRILRFDTPIALPAAVPVATSMAPLATLLVLGGSTVLRRRSSLETCEKARS